MPEKALDPKIKSPLAQNFEQVLRRKVVGQEAALEKIASLFQVYLAGLNPPGRPIGNMLFLGPTGTGKTRVVEAVAEALYADPRAMIKIDCAEFQHSHEIAKLIGSPPGYLGHRETHPVLTQEAINQWHNEQYKISIFLLDEIEKASDALWQLLLGILDKAVATLGDNRRVDFSQALIFMTSNLGSTEINRLVEGGIGFLQPGSMASGETVEQNTQDLDRKIESTAGEAARRRFSPEFLNRIDYVVVFRQLTSQQLRQVLDLELDLVQSRVMAGGHNRFMFQLSDTAKDFLLEKGVDRRYGARHLKRAIEHYLVQPLASLLASGQIDEGDAIYISLEVETSVEEFSFKRTDKDIRIAGLAAKAVNASPSGAAALSNKTKPSSPWGRGRR